MSLRKMLVGTALSAAALYGGAAAASDYPPDAPPPSTVVASSQSGGTPDAPTRTSQLANTGSSDSGAIIKIGGAAVLAGAGLVLVAKRRRNVAPT